jgi:hypothetical protein
MCCNVEWGRWNGVGSPREILESTDGFNKVMVLINNQKVRVESYEARIKDLEDVVNGKFPGISGTPGDSNPGALDGVHTVAHNLRELGTKVQGHATALEVLEARVTTMEDAGREHCRGLS